MIKSFLITLSLIPLITFSQVQVAPMNSTGLDKIMLPKGYKIEVYASGVVNAREMDFAEDGTLFAGSTDAGKVYAIRPDRSVIVIDDSLEMPAGLDYYNGDLYVSEISRILKYENILQTADSSPIPLVLNSNFPSDTLHGWKFIRVGPDGKLYIPVGAPCNACIPENKWYSRILMMSLDGKSLEYYAEGVRNVGGFDWDASSGVLWFTDRGREDMGEDFPPDELNSAPVDGGHFGFPYINGKVLDPEFWPKRPQNRVFTTPALALPAHIGVSGMRFYTGGMFDKKYKGGIFIAEQGSLNRSENAGYRISYITFFDDRAIGYEVFAAGWQEGDTAWGRPADVQVGPDGSLFVSDDLAGCIYRIYVQR
jgi:glucose/arabinose dehydrogenase